MGVIGQAPRDLHDIENSSTSAIVDTKDANDTAISVRMLAKSATLKAVAERRLAMADHSKPHKIDPADVPKGSLVALYRTPDKSDSPGWRGPAILLDEMNTEVGTADVR